MSSWSVTSFVVLLSMLFCVSSASASFSASRAKINIALVRKWPTGSRISGFLKQAPSWPACPAEAEACQERIVENRTQETNGTSEEFLLEGPNSYRVKWTLCYYMHMWGVDNVRLRWNEGSCSASTSSWNWAGTTYAQTVNCDARPTRVGVYATSYSWARFCLKKVEFFLPSYGGRLLCVASFGNRKMTPSVLHAECVDVI